jgi:hypothetical protein
MAGVNLDLLRKKLDTISGKNKTSNHFWKPENGTQTVRIVPYKYNLENPFIELRFYYYQQRSAPTKTFLSPNVVGEPDPVLEFCEKLRATGTKENWILSKRYEPKLRTYVPVIVRGEEDKGVRFWGFGKTVYEMLLKKMANPDFGDITDLEEGNDVIVEFTKTPPSGKTFPETTIEVRVKKTPAVDPSNDKMVAMLTNQVDIMTLFTVPKYEDLKREFENSINPEEEDPNVEPAESGAVSDDETLPQDSGGSSVEVPSDVSEDTPVVSPSAEKAEQGTVSNQEQLKAKFKKMFAEAAAK